MVPSSVVQAKGQVTIPKEAREELGLRPGDEVIWIRTKAGVWQIWSGKALMREFDRASEGLTESLRR